MVLQGSPAMFLMCAHSFPLFQKGDRGEFPSHSTSPSAKKQTSPVPSPIEEREPWYLRVLVLSFSVAFIPPPSHDRSVAKLKGCFKNRSDFVICHLIVHVDAAHAGEEQVTRFFNAACDHLADVFTCLSDDLDGTQPYVEECVRELLAQGAQVSPPSNIQKIQVRDPPPHPRKAMRVSATIMNAERPMPLAPCPVERQDKLFIMCGRHHCQGTL